MTTKYLPIPKIISSVSKINGNGDEILAGDFVTGISVRQTDGDMDGECTIDVRNFNKNGTNLIIKMSLPELICAISRATLNADRDVSK